DIRADIVDGSFVPVGDVADERAASTGCLEGRVLMTATRTAGCTMVAMLGCSMMLAATDPSLAQVPGGCETPVSERTSEAGCYFVASEVLGELPPTALYWHLYNYPTRPSAEASKGPRGTVVESFGKVWLYTIAEAE